MDVIGRRSALLLLVIGIAALTVCYIYYSNRRNIGGHSRRLAPISRRNHSLAIHMVVVPHFVYENSSQHDLLLRQEEYRTSLQRNLNHEFVSRVHVLTTSAKDIMEHLQRLANHTKLVVAEVSSTELMRDPWEYISQKLVGKDVMFANADIYLGDGFELVDPFLMAQQKIMYSLTRQVADRDRCPGVSNFCLDEVFQGSHDSFLCHLTEPLPDEALTEMEFKLPSYGMENVVLWIFQEMLHFCTLNPCSILETFHLHCSRFKGSDYKRVNGVHSGVAAITNNLLC